MIPGYNHNVKYKDRVYHVQTEDSGVQTPHVITHLFVGGNIVESRKTSYADIVTDPRLGELLVEIMQAQHKGMLKDLIGGKLDPKIAERSKNAATLNGPAPLNVDAGAQHRSSFGLPVEPAVAKQVATPAPAPAPIAEKPLQPSAGAYARAAATGTPVKSDANPFSQAPRPPPGPAAKPAQSVPPAKPPTAPPPLAARPATPPPRPAPVAQAQATPPTLGGLPPKSSTALPKAGAPAAITRPVPPPAPIASAPKPAETVLEAEALARAFESKNESAVDSIFGEDLISEKSLDEVILSYLADDLQKE